MLKGIKIIDFSKWLPGQYCGMLLGDYGADILKIEAPEGDGPRHFSPQKTPGMSYWHLMLNRNKRDLVIDIKTAEGPQKLRSLLAEADVFLEGFRPGYLARYGLDYEQMHRLNPRLIYVSITGFGQNSHLPAHDLNVIGLAGLNNTDQGHNLAVPDVQVSALTAGTNAFAAISLALLDREKTGSGRHIDISLYAAALNLQATQIATYYGCREQGEKPFSRFTHYYNIYRCQDGRYLTVGTLEPKFWQQFCDLIACPELKERQFDFAHEQELINLVAAKIAAKTQQEWLELIGDKNFCVTPVRNLEEVLHSGLTQQQHMLKEVTDKEYGELHYIGYPIKFSDYEEKTPQRAQRLGESNA